MATAYTDQVQKVYIAYYGRAADPVGLKYWAGKVETDGLAGIMAEFGASAEATTLFGSLTSNTAKVNALYQQSFGRDADFAGLMYYAGELTAGTMTAASIAQNIFDGASGADATILANKLIVAKAYTAAIDTSAEVVAYAGDVAAASARALLTTVDAPTVTTGFDVATSIAATVTANAAVPAASAQTLVLTTSVDNLVGGAGDDSLSGQMDGTAALNTASIVDSINGGNGTDTFTLINTTANAVSTQGVGITNVENYKYFASNGGDLDFDDAGSATSFEITRTAGASNLTDVRTTDTVKFTESAATMDSNMTYNATNVGNAADEATVTLSGVSAGADLAFVGAVETMNLVTTGTASSFADLDFAATTTTLNITAGAALTTTGANASTGITSATITGSGAVTLNAALSAATTIDGSAMTGALTIVAGATAATISSGTAADVIDMAGTLTSADTIDLGDGDDTLRVDLDGLTAGSADHKISNVETLRLDNTAGNNGAMQMDNLAFTTVRLDSGTIRTGVLTLTDLAVTTTDIKMLGAGTLDADLGFNRTVLDYDTTTDVANVTVTINNGGKTADDILVGIITADNVDKITIIGTEIGQAAADELTIDEIEGDSMTDLVITADGEVIVTDIDGNVVDTIDFSDADKGVAATVSDHAAALTITMGDGADTVTMTDNSAASEVTIDLGSGVDSYISVDAADTITTGSGSDTIAFQGDSTDDLNTITDFTVGSGGDIIDLVTSTAATVGSPLAYLEIASSATLDDGMTVYTGNDLSAITTGALVTALAAAIIVDAQTIADQVYIVAGDGTDAGIFLFDDDAVATAVAVAELTLLVTLTGVSDTALLGSANFADFI